MKVKIVVALGVLALLKDAAKVLVIASPIDSSQVEAGESEFETLSNCSHVEMTEECVVEEGRKRKKMGSNGNNGNNVVIIESDNGHQGGGAGVIGPFGLEEYFEVEDDSSSSKRGKGKKGRKHKKKGKKIFKKMQPMLIGLGAMKLIFYHLFLKKLAIVTFFTFLLSKVSFILATLVALKQFFHTPTQHRSHDSDKLEVVHIPIRKHRYKEEKDKDSYYDESKFIPITFAPDTVYDTTPFYYDFPFNEHNPESFASSEDGFDANFDGKFSGKFKGDLNENFKDNLNENFNDNTNDDFNDIYNEHFESFKKKPSSAADKSDDYNEKNFYKNHVHSPFI